MVEGSDGREGEIQLGFDPAERIDAGVAFIGHIRSDWSRGNSPRNITQGREAGGGNARNRKSFAARNRDWDLLR